MLYPIFATPLRVGTGAGLAIGMFGAVAIGLASESLLAGAIFGIATGLPSGIVMGRSSRHRLDLLTDLSSTDRATVVRTVMRGLPTSDLRLAPAVLDYARAVREQNMGWTTPGRHRGSSSSLP